MESRVGTTCKSTAVILGTLGLIGAIAVAVHVESILAFLASALGVFLFCLALFALGEIIDLLDANKRIMSQETDRIVKAISHPEVGAGGKASVVVSPSGRRTQDGSHWMCPCGRENPMYTTTCTCGRNKRDVVG